MIDIKILFDRLVVTTSVAIAALFAIEMVKPTTRRWQFAEIGALRKVFSMYYVLVHPLTLFYAPYNEFNGFW